MDTRATVLSTVLPVADVVHSILVCADTEVIDEWRSNIMRGMDVHAWPSDITTDMYRDMPPGFRLNYDEDHEPCGWFWYDDVVGILNQPFIGADAIVSFLLKRAQSEFAAYEVPDVR